jgi:hypothetical protein
VQCLKRCRFYPQQTVFKLNSSRQQQICRGTDIAKHAYKQIASKQGQTSIQKKTNLGQHAKPTHYPYFA